MKSLFMLVVICLLAIGCSDAPSQIQTESGSSRPEIVVTQLDNGESSHVTIQHILIAFDGSLPGKPVKRTQVEAGEFAVELFARAKAGEDFDQLVKDESDDGAPGIYRLANFDQTIDMTSPDQSQWTRPRTSMVLGFAETCFRLKVGEVGVADFNQSTSPYGWHIIKRLE